MVDAVETVVLVDDTGRDQGVCEKIEAHRRGLRHRAISVFVKDRRNRLLLQQRAPAKYHSAGLWANACCSHPRLGEASAAAARRRLREEMGIDCDLEHRGRHAYCERVGDDMVENEVVELFFGHHDGAVAPDPGEVSDFVWLPVPDLLADFRRRPDRYTVWFRDYLRTLGPEIDAWARGADRS